MGLNRMMMMKNGEDLKGIKAMMTVRKQYSKYGFQEGKFGSLSPNPLPNGVLVTKCYTGSLGSLVLEPSSIKSCTINNITAENYDSNNELVSYLKRNVDKTIPVIFHFD